MMDNTVAGCIHNEFPISVNRIILHLRFNHFHILIPIVTTTCSKYCAQAVILFVKIAIILSLSNLSKHNLTKSKRLAIAIKRTFNIRITII